MTNAELLDLVTQAIEARIDPSNGLVQSYMIDGRRVDKIPLGELRAMKKDLQATAMPTGGKRTFAELEDA